MRPATCQRMQEHLSSEGVFLLADAQQPGFPLRYASPGFEQAYGYRGLEIVGQKCGELIGTSVILDDPRILATAAAASRTTPEDAETKLCFLKDKAGEACRVMMANPGERVGVVLLLNQRKNGAVFVCEILLLNLRHPSLDWSYCVGFLRDVTREVPVHALFDACRPGEYSRLLQSRAQALEARRATLLDTGSAGVVQHLHEKALSIFSLDIWRSLRADLLSEPATGDPTEAEAQPRRPPRATAGAAGGGRRPQGEARRRSPTKSGALPRAQDLLSAEGVFLLADSQQQGFPIRYASPGFEQAYGYRGQEIVGRKCGDLIGPPAIIGNTTILANVAAASGATLKDTESKLRFLKERAGDACRAMMENPDELAGVALLLNRRKSGMTFVCEVILLNLRHPTLNWSCCAGFLRDVSREVSVGALLAACAPGEYGRLLQSRTLALEARQAALQAAGSRSIMRQLQQKALSVFPLDIWRTLRADLLSSQPGGTALPAMDASAGTPARRAPTAEAQPDVPHGAGGWAAAGGKLQESSEEVEEEDEEHMRCRGGAARPAAACRRVREESLASEDIFLLADTQQQGFPLRYASPGFEEAYGYRGQELVGQKCGDLIGPPVIMDDPAVLATAAAAWGATVDETESRLSFLKEKAGEACRVMMANPGERVGVVLLLNRRKSGAVFVCEILLLTLRHPTLNWSYCVGFLRDVTGEVSARALLSACRPGEYSRLLQSRAQALEARRSALLRAGSEGLVQQLHERALSVFSLDIWRALRADLLASQPGGAGEPADGDVEITPAGLVRDGAHGGGHAGRLALQLAVGGGLQEDAKKRILMSNPAVAFLSDIGLSEYAEALLLNGFDDLESVLHMDDEDMKALGLLRGHAAKLRRKIAAYRGQDQERPAASYKRSASPGGASPVSDCGSPRAEVQTAAERTWEGVRAVGVELLGEAVMRNFFELSAEAGGLFSPDARADAWDQDASGPKPRGSGRGSAALRKMAVAVLEVVGSSAAGWRDAEELVPELLQLGARHGGYGAKQEHFALLGEALIHAVREALGHEEFPAEAQQAWSVVYGFVSATVLWGAQHSARLVQAAEELAPLRPEGPQAAKAAGAGAAPTGAPKQPAGPACRAPLFEFTPRRSAGLTEAAALRQEHAPRQPAGSVPQAAQQQRARDSRKHAPVPPPPPVPAGSGWAEWSTLLQRMHRGGRDDSA